MFSKGNITGLEIGDNEGRITIPVLLWLDNIVKDEKKSGISFRPCLIKSPISLDEYLKLNNPMNEKCCNLVSKREITNVLSESEIQLVIEKAKSFSTKFLHFYPPKK